MIDIEKHEKIYKRIASLEFWINKYDTIPEEATIMYKPTLDIREIITQIDKMGVN